MDAVSAAMLVFTVLAGAGLAWCAVNAISRGAEVYGGDYSKQTAKAFEDIFLFVSPRKVAEWAWAAAGTTAFALFLILGGVSGSIAELVVRIAISVAAGSAMLLAPSRLFVIMRNRRRNKFDKQLVDALSDMSGALRSGYSIVQTIEHVSENSERPLSQEFATFLHQTRIGVPFSDALRNLQERVGSEDLELVTMSIETARRTGGNLADIFENISKTIRERMRIRERVRTLTAQGRMQGVVLSLMPLAIAAALQALEPRMFGSFLHSAMGLGIVAAVAVLLALGALSIRKIVNIDI